MWPACAPSNPDVDFLLKSFHEKAGNSQDDFGFT
jgi:hypothetical protein